MANSKRQLTIFFHIFQTFKLHVKLLSCVRQSDRLTHRVQSEGEWGNGLNFAHLFNPFLP